MDLISASTGLTIAARSTADILPSQAKQDAVALPKRDRRLTLTRIDRRSRLGRRVAELAAIFSEAIAGDISPMRRLKIERAAQMTGLAELARGDFMRDGKGTLSDVILAERRAAAAVKALAIVEETRAKGPTLADYLAARAGNDGEETE